VQDWHDVREPSPGKIRPETLWNEEPVKDGLSARDIARNHRQPGRQEPKIKRAGTSEEGEDNHKCHRTVESRAAITSRKRRTAPEAPI
jgi:hypothetical protein